MHVREILNILSEGINSCLTAAVALYHQPELHNRFRNPTLKHVFFFNFVSLRALGMQFYGSNLIVFAIPITQARGFNQFIYRDEVGILCLGGVQENVPVKLLRHSS